MNHGGRSRHDATARSLTSVPVAVHTERIAPRVQLICIVIAAGIAPPVPLPVRAVRIGQPAELRVLVEQGADACLGEDFSYACLLVHLNQHQRIHTTLQVDEQQTLPIQKRVKQVRSSTAVRADSEIFGPFSVPLASTAFGSRRAIRVDVEGP